MQDDRPQSIGGPTHGYRDAGRHTCMTEPGSQAVRCNCIFCEASHSERVIEYRSAFALFFIEMDSRSIKWIDKTAMDPFRWDGCTHVFGFTPLLSAKLSDRFNRL